MFYIYTEVNGIPVVHQATTYTQKDVTHLLIEGASKYDTFLDTFVECDNEVLTNFMIYNEPKYPLYLAALKANNMIELYQTMKESIEKYNRKQR